MTYGMEVIGRLELGEIQTAYEVFPRSYANAKVSNSTLSFQKFIDESNFVFRHHLESGLKQSLEEQRISLQEPEDSYKYDKKEAKFKKRELYYEE
jgi:hypothetical protein